MLSALIIGLHNILLIINVRELRRESSRGYISNLWLDISAVHGYLKPLLVCQIVMRLFQTNLFTDTGDPCKQLLNRPQTDVVARRG